MHSVQGWSIGHTKLIKPLVPNSGQPTLDIFHIFRLTAKTVQLFHKTIQTLWQSLERFERNFVSYRVTRTVLISSKRTFASLQSKIELSWIKNVIIQTLPLQTLSPAQKKLAIAPCAFDLEQLLSSECPCGTGLTFLRRKSSSALQLVRSRWLHHFAFMNTINVHRSAKRDMLICGESH